LIVKFKKDGKKLNIVYMPEEGAVGSFNPKKCIKLTGDYPTSRGKLLYVETENIL